MPVAAANGRRPLAALWANPVMGSWRLDRRQSHDFSLINVPFAPHYNGASRDSHVARSRFGRHGVFRMSCRRTSARLRGNLHGRSLEAIETLLYCICAKKPLASRQAERPAQGASRNGERKLSEFTLNPMPSCANSPLLDLPIRQEL
jgi:hypothetical protein